MWLLCGFKVSSRVKWQGFQRPEWESTCSGEHSPKIVSATGRVQSPEEEDTCELLSRLTTPYIYPQRHNDFDNDHCGQFLPVPAPNVTTLLPHPRAVCAHIEPALIGPVREKRAGKRYHHNIASSCGCPHYQRRSLVRSHGLPALMTLMITSGVFQYAPLPSSG